MKPSRILFLLIFTPFFSGAQQFTNKTMDSIVIRGYRTINGVGHLLEVKDGILYAGKKNEVIIIDSMDANKAINNTRQILGRIPGLNIVETESSGFTANGIATRGLNPSQSIEMNTRQNGYNVSADIHGYNEAYYLPPMEAVNRIEMVRGASSLQFGAQFGGMVNYVIKDGPRDRDIESNTSLTIGSHGLFNAFQSVGGTKGKWNYYGYIQHRTLDGYRANSDQKQVSAFAKVQYTASDRVRVSLEYSLLRNRVHMPGGLSDSLFRADLKTSTRARNWLKSPWNVLSATMHHQLDRHTSFDLKLTGMLSNRSLVWRNEDGGPAAADDIDPVTLQHIPREVESEDMRSLAAEARLSHEYALGRRTGTLATGVRASRSLFKRLGGGQGTTGSDENYAITGTWEYAFDFSTTNIAAFAENIFRIGRSLTVTPGFRYEFLRSSAFGYRLEDADKLTVDGQRTRTFPLLGLGMEYHLGKNASIYGNVSQAYRPIDYGALEPFGVTSRIDDNLKDSRGHNADLGFRALYRNILNIDISLFHLSYRDRIGTVLKTDPATGEEYTLRTNVANSVHQGLESYLEVNVLKWLSPASHFGLSVFHSFAWIDARYTTGEFKGNRVEAASKIIQRAGLTLSAPRVTGTFQYSHVGDAFGDASNAMTSENPAAGYIPAYNVMDLSVTYKMSHFALKAGVNNLADRSYFTRRTDEYPGPGIIPAVGRSVYLTFSTRF
jgi:Fe(3+) dicitrate transport protein